VGWAVGYTRVYPVLNLSAHVGPLAKCRIRGEPWRVCQKPCQMFSQVSCKDLIRCAETTSTSAHTWRPRGRSTNMIWQRPSALKHASGAQCIKPVIYGMSWGVHDMYQAWVWILMFAHMNATDAHTHVSKHMRARMCEHMRANVRVQTYRHM
jgi:hypothetical protein